MILALGFIIGRLTIPTKTISNTITEYIPGATIRDSISYPVEVKVEVPSDPEYIYVPGEPQVVDTLAILADWILKRKYQEVLFDNDSIGKFTLRAEVQYNKLSLIDYDYNPIQRQTTVTTIKTKEKLFTPFVFLGYNTGNYGSITGGLFIKNFGIAYEGVLKFNDNNLGNQYYHGLKLGVKF